MVRFWGSVTLSVAVMAASFVFVPATYAETLLSAPVGAPVTKTGEQSTMTIQSPLAATQAQEGVNGDVGTDVTYGRDVPLVNPYPWTAAVLEDQPEGWREFLCSGTLIAPDWIMTTANCVQPEEKELDISQTYIMVGGRDLSTGLIENRHQVAQIYVHPEWNRSTLLADVALLRLQTPSQATPIGLLGAEPVMAGTQARIAGWGRSLAPTSGTLQWGDVEILADPTDKFCRELNYLPAYGPVFASQWMTCAMGSGVVRPVDVCEGDQGGPLMVDVEGTWKLAGIASWVEPCGDYFYPGVFTRTSTALPWVEKQMANPDITACSTQYLTPFRDVKKQAFYSDAVSCLVTQKITTVSASKRFSPESYVNRAQMAAFLWRMNKNPQRPNYVFRDETKIPVWAAEAADWLKAEDITTNDPYRPKLTVTRGQMASFLWRLAGEPETSEECGFTDIPNGAHFAQAACWLKETGITTGWNGDLTRFKPGAGLTRGQMAAFLYRFGLNQSYWFNLP